MKRRIIPYNPRLKKLARKLRKQGILSEVLLWQQLKGKQLIGYDFHRQKPIGDYIVDFFCQELMLVIEIDGCSHSSKLKDDQNRQRQLEKLGVNVLRFLDSDIRKNLDNVLSAIREWIEKRTTQSPPQR